MTRNQRRKRAKAANMARTESIAKASLAYDRALIVKRNMASKPERNYYNPRSCIADLDTMSHRGYVCRA